MTFFPVSVDELKYDKNRIFTRLKLRADPNTNAYAESIFPYLVELLRENIELVLAYNITDNDLTIASPELSSCDMLAVCYCGATQKIVDCVDDLMARSDFLEGYILNDLANEVLFNASNAMNRRLYNEFKAQGYHLSTRLTPGENHLSMEYQAQFLSLLTQGEPFPATLTEHYMLQPEKAMLYAYGAAPASLTGPSITTAPNARISRAICAGTRIRKQEAAFMEYTVRIAGTPCRNARLRRHACRGVRPARPPARARLRRQRPLREMRCSRGAPRRARDRARVHHARHGGHHRFP